MRGKILVLVLALALVLLATPYVSSVPGSEKRNEKFLSLEINKVGAPPGPGDPPPTIIVHPAPPKEPKFRRLIAHEKMASLEIIINGGDPYVLGVDFTYESTLTIDFHLNSVPMFGGLTVKQTYAFLPASGIDGSLEVLTIGKYWPNGKDGSSAADSWGVSIGHGTGDLEGVLLKATGWHRPEGIHHEGYVTNWPGLQ